jgi:hypothetical protein
VTGPEVVVAGRRIPAFRACGLQGVVAAVAVGLLLVDGSKAVMAAVCVAACGAFLALALVTKVLGGAERLVYYHHQAAVVAVAALVPWALGKPVLPYLDAAAVGLGVFLACGRLGCLLAGCCHGKPASHGVRYRAEHAEEGFPAYLVGVPLVPVQALESVGVLVIAAVGAGIVLADADAGSALAWYLTAYAVLRFGLELLRGDPPRPYVLGLSAAQWTSLAVVFAVALADAAPGYTAAAGALAGGAVVVAARRRPLFSPRHVAELANALDGDGVRETSLGLRVSSGAVDGITHYTLSRRGEALADRDAAALARLLTRLRHGGATVDVVRTRSGAVHIVTGRVLPTAPGPYGRSRPT